MEPTRCAVVFDTGSSSTRVGLSHDTTPTTYPSFVTPIDETLYVGHQPQQESTSIERRVIHGMVQNWDYMPKFLEHGFKLLNVKPENHSVVLNKSSNPFFESDNQRIAQIMFEEFNIPALHLNYQPVLSLYGLGSLTGLVVASGFGETQFYPVYEGLILRHAVYRGLQIGGNDLTWFLSEAIEKKGYKCDYETANNIKEKALYISTDTNKENAVEETFELPDGNKVSLSKEKYLIPEQLFTSTMELCGVDEFVYSTLNRCDAEVRKCFFENIVLSGGNSQLPGFAERLEKELVKKRSDFKSMQNCVPKITKTTGSNSVWIGGTVLASLSTFPDMCMTQEEYNEYGPTLVETKFFN